MKSSVVNKRLISSLLCLDLLLLVITGITVSILESEGRYMLWIIMILFLILLNYVILDRFQFSIKNVSVIDRKVNPKIEDINEKKPNLYLEGKSYLFSFSSIIILIIGAPLLSYFILSFFSMEINFWLQELMAKQTVFLLKSFLNIDSRIQYQSEVIYPWVIYIPRTKNTFRISLECTGIHVFSIFIGIIVCTPASKDQITREDFLWRKMKAFIISLLIFYSFNLLRIILLIYLDYIGIPWSFFHSLINDLSGVVAAIIFSIILYTWIPEFFLSIYYIYPVIRAKIDKVKNNKTRFRLKD